VWASSKRICLHLLACLCAALSWGCQLPRSAGTHVLIHVTHGANDPQRVLMALQMADALAAQHAVTVFFDCDAVGVALKDAPNLSFRQFPFSHEQLYKLHSRGVRLRACPDCLKAIGKSAEDLFPGVEVADYPSLFAGARATTLSY